MSRKRKKPKHRVTIAPSARRSVIARDGKHCRYCGRGPLLQGEEHEGKNRFLTLDHLRPSRFGGTNIQTNLVVACKDCNHRKGDAALHEIGWALLPPRLHAMTNYEREDVGWGRNMLAMQRERIKSTTPVYNYTQTQKARHART